MGIGGQLTPSIPVYHEQALEQALNGEQPDIQYRVNLPETLIDAERRLHQTIEEHIERVVEERAQQRSLLESIDLGTLSEEYKYRMQILAGIDPNNTSQPEMEAEQPDVPSTPTKTNWFKRLLRL